MRSIHFCNKKEDLKIKGRLRFNLLKFCPIGQVLAEFDVHLKWKNIFEQNIFNFAELKNILEQNIFSYVESWTEQNIQNVRTFLNINRTLVPDHFSDQNGQIRQNCCRISQINTRLDPYKWFQVAKIGIWASLRAFLEVMMHFIYKRSAKMLKITWDNLKIGHFRPNFNAVKMFIKCSNILLSTQKNIWEHEH